MFISESYLEILNFEININVHIIIFFISDEPRSRCRSWDDVGPIAMDTVSQHSRHQRLPMEPIGSNTSTRSARSEDSWCSASDHDLSSDEESEKSSVSIK